MAQGKYSHRRRRLNPRFVILVLIFITILALLGTLLLRRCERKAEAAPTTAATLADPATQPATKPTTKPTTAPATAATTEATTAPSTEATTEVTTEATTEATTEETTTETTQPETVPTVPPTVPPAPESSSIGAQVAALAREQVGKPYLYGGVGPDAFDSSGLVVYCFSQNGTEVPRTTDYQVSAGVAVPWDAIEPGDVVFFWLENPGAAEYEGIYVGDGKFIAARSEGKPVSEMDLWGDYFSSQFVCARRYY